MSLKQDGTVWTFGANNASQLGIGNNENSLKPTKINTLTDIKQISAGNSHGMALTKTGEIYTWGSNSKFELGIGSNVDSNIPVKVEGLSNIVKIDAYKNRSMALSKDGRVYIWGEGYGSIPMRVFFDEPIIDISGDLALTSRGKVYDITTMTLINGFENIAKISCGTDHKLALSTDGTAYSYGANNTSGKLGVTTGIADTVYNIADNIYEVSGGNGTTMLLTSTEEVYAAGNNANGQVGLGTTANTGTLTKVTGITNVENISAGEGTHSAVSDMSRSSLYIWK